MKELSDIVRRIFAGTTQLNVLLWESFISTILLNFNLHIRYVTNQCSSKLLKVTCFIWDI